MTLDDDLLASLTYATTPIGWLDGVSIHRTGHGGADAEYMRAWRRRNPERYREIHLRRVETLKRERIERFQRIAAIIAPFVARALICRVLLRRATETARQRRRRARRDVERLRELNRKHQAARRERLRAAGLTTRGRAAA